MYAAAAWLVWVLAQQAGPRGVGLVSAAMIALALAAWLWNVTRNLSGRGRMIGAVAALLVLAGGLYGISLLRGAQASPATQSAKAGEAYSPAKLASLRAANRPVFVDATAAWCITCLVNEDAVLSRDSVKSAFASKNVAYLVADWTNQNPDVTALLKENGRSGVPLYLYYAPGARTPTILPQILTERRRAGRPRRLALMQRASGGLGPAEITGQIVAFPFQELLRREAIAAAGFQRAQHAGMHRGDDLRLAAGDPASGGDGRQLKRHNNAAFRRDDAICRAPVRLPFGIAVGFVLNVIHGRLLLGCRPQQQQPRRRRFKTASRKPAGF